MNSTTMTLRLTNQLKTQLEKLAKATHRSKSFLAAEAIGEYLKLQQWQISEIKKGIAEADAGYLVEHSSVLKHWEKRRANSVDKNG
jgi:RHH-type rel operon transcriptional repressor/antitoxin RelB